MSSVEFSMKYEDVEKIKDSIQKFDGDAESVINKYLEKEAKNKIINSIVDFIPVSKEKYPSQIGKIHAKHSKPLTGKRIANLTLKINTKKDFNYLYFPQMAEGTSKGKQPNDFMEKGIDKVYDNVVNQMLDRLINKMEAI